MDADLSGITRTLSALRVASPDFVSVTYGAGGNNRPRAQEIANIVVSLGMSPLSHLTAVGYTKDETDRVLASLGELGVENILALRGDIPVGVDRDDARNWPDFRRACDLSRHIMERGRFCVGGAAYPEGHSESVSTEADIAFMKDKVASGTTFFITQLFFDNDCFKRFAARAYGSGVDAPIIAGIMPVFKARQIRRIVEISGCSVPKRLNALLERYLDDDASMKEAGIDYAAEQISDLWAEGFGVHVYTMNKSKGVLEIMRRCGFVADENDGGPQA
jgi:methylenetetrahydrofolate reductase (NADPH)